MGFSIFCSSVDSFTESSEPTNHHILYTQKHRVNHIVKQEVVKHPFEAQPGSDVEKSKLKFLFSQLNVVVELNLLLFKIFKRLYVTILAFIAHCLYCNSCFRGERISQSSTV